VASQLALKLMGRMFSDSSLMSKT